MANEYKVKVGVEFNAIMTKVDSALTSLQEKLKKLGSLTGAKDVTGGLSEGLQKIVNGFNELKDFTITPKNLNEFMGKLQVLEDELQKVGISAKDINVGLFDEKNQTAAQNVQRVSDEIKQLEANIDILQKKKEANNAADPFTEADAKSLENYRQQLEKAKGSLKGYNSYQSRLETAAKNLGITEEELTKILQLLAQAHKEAGNAAGEQAKGQTQLENSKLADTIQTQVNRYIGLTAIWRYSKKYIQDLIKTYKEFDQSLVAIAAVTGQTRDQMWQNIGVYNKMAQSLGTTTQEVINASKLYYQQGLTTTSVLKLTEETVKLATIAELDSADATEYLTTAMNGFKLSAEESTRVTDVWANLAAKTASDVDELAIAISKVASLAENAGMEIETASAFLNQMIETTREAPENLGTALKTIIARFQELKTSEEALSDGVDANKVERALKSAGVALRDVDGQFRDFDEVILELSSKWNILDRNTQRYIATIAAGSRQQSRFIAMVSDYEGLLRNVNYAYDSLGSADAQMAVFQEGLAASTNRLTAAWEGLYTSWSESATVISKLIDAAAEFVSTLADLGAGASSVIAIFGVLTATILAKAAAMAINTTATTADIVANINNASALAIKNAQNVYEEKVIKKATKAMLEHTGAAAADTAQNLANAASQALIIVQYAGIALLIGGIIYLLVRWVTQEERLSKQLAKQATETKQLAAQEKDRASNLGVLIDELNRVHKAGEDETETRQKIADQFGEELGEVNALTLSYKELVEILEKEQQAKNRSAAASYQKSWELNQEQHEVDKDIYIRKNLPSISTQEDAGTVLVGDSYVQAITWNGEQFTANPDTGTFINSEGKTVEEKYNELYEKLAQDFEHQNPVKINRAEKAFVVENITDQIDLGDLSKSDIDTIFLEYVDKIKGVFDEAGNLTDYGLDFYQSLANGLQQSFSSDEISKIVNVLNGDLNDLSLDLVLAIEKNLGENSALGLKFRSLYSDLNNQLTAGWEEVKLGTDVEEKIKNNLSASAQKAFISTFNNLSNDQAAQQAYVNAILNLIDSNIPIETISDSFVSALGNVEEGMEKYTALLTGFGEGTEESAKQLELLRHSLGLVNSDFVTGMDVIKDYNGVMDDFDALMSGKLSDDDYSARLESLIDTLEALGVAERSEIETMLYAASIRDANGARILEETGAINGLVDSLYTEGETAVAAKRAEIEAYAAQLDVTADHVIAIGKEMQAQEAAGHANSVATDALLENAYNEILALDDLETKALEAYDATEGGPGEAMKQQTTIIRRWAAQIKEGMSGAQVQALGESMKQSAKEARSMAAALAIAKRELGKAGKSAGSAAKETDKYKEALKELQDQLKEAKEAAEEYIDAILDYLAEEKEAAQEAIDAAEEALEKERSLLKIQLEAWKEYLEQRQKENQDALDLQGQAAAEYFKAEIESIQLKIDALDKEAEAEDRILKLQKARDEYNRAQNSRTRLVLTKGAGWIFKADQKEISDARKTLNDVQREIQKAAYQDQIDELQKQADMWQEIADGITKSAEEIAKLAAAVDKFRQGMAEGGTGYADVDAYGTAVTAQQGANDEYQRQLEEVEKWLEQADWSYQDYMDDQARQQFLKEFMDGTVGEQDLQEKVTTYLEDMLKTEAYIEEQKKLIEKIEKIEAEYELEKAQLGLTKKQLKEARKIRKAIEKAFDPESGDLGLGKGSSYYQEVVSPLVETVQKIAEELAKLEAGQGSGSSNGSGSGSGSGSSGSEDSGSSGTPSQESTDTTYWDRSKDKEDTSATSPETSSSWHYEYTSGGLDYYTDGNGNWFVYPTGSGYGEEWLKGLEQGTVGQNPPGPSPIGTPGFATIGGNGIGLPTTSTLSIPSFSKVTNNSSAMTINIGTLQSSANNFDGLVADITRNSMLRQPI